MKFKAIIFDMDGTIINTEAIWKKANLEVLKRRSIPLTQNDIDRMHNHMHGLPIFDCCTYLKLEFNLEESIHDLVQEKALFAQTLFGQEICFIEGFIEFHQQVQIHNLKTAIATNANDDTIASTDKVLNLQKYFGNHIYGISYVKQGKPDPAIFHHAAEQLEADPKDCIVIEDSKPGIEAAKKAGMFCIGINTAKKREYLNNADYIIDYYHQIDLKSILEKKF